MKSARALTAVSAGATAVGIAVVKKNPQLRTRADRTLRIWRLSARRGVHWAVVRVRGRDADEQKRAQLEEQFVIKSAQDVAEVLGNMKGAIMKAGQMFSFIADGLPPEAAAALSRLQSDVAPMAPSLASQVIERELGDRPENVFLDWNPVPVAAASIGQVHKAVLRDGRQVAVKVQYPGVDAAIGSDLENAQLLYGMFSQFALPSLDVKAMIDEVRSRMTEELDYRIEARSQREFSDYYSGHPFIHVPIVVDEYSTRRVLTSEWVEGLSWNDFLTQAGDATKQKTGEVLMRFAQGSVYFHKMFNGDPHPGNYRFHLDGTVTFLDFGLVKRWTEAEVAELTPVLDAVLAKDAPELAKQVVRLNALAEGNDVDPMMLLDYASTPYVPFIASEFTYTREWMASALAKVMDFEGDYRVLLDKINLPTSYIILDRLVWGVGALLGRLDAHNRWGDLLDEYRRDGPPVSELGRQEAEWRVRRTSTDEQVVAR